MTYWDYVKAAFHSTVPVPGLGALPLNKLALAGFAILGVAHPGFWLLGAAYEAAFLTFVPSNPRFQRVIQGLALMQRKQVSGPDSKALLGSLAPAGITRFQQLAATCKTIVEAPEAGASGELAQLKSGELNELLWVFLKLLVSQQKITELLRKTDEDSIQREIQQLQARLSAEAEGSPLRRSLEGSIDIQTRRLENLQRAKESLKVAEAELTRIEQQAALLAEESTLGRSPEALSTRLNGVMTSLQGTSQWMAQHSDIFTSMEEAAPQDLLAKE